MNSPNPSHEDSAHETAQSEGVAGEIYSLANEMRELRLEAHRLYRSWLMMIRTMAIALCVVLVALVVTVALK